MPDLHQNFAPVGPAGFSVRVCLSWRVWVAVSEVVAPIAWDRALDHFPVSEASFQKLRAANAALRASNTDLEESNRESVAVLEAAEAKIIELSPVSPSLSMSLIEHTLR